MEPETKPPMEMQAELVSFRQIYGYEPAEAKLSQLMATGVPQLSDWELTGRVLWCANHPEAHFLEMSVRANAKKPGILQGKEVERVNGPMLAEVRLVVTPTIQLERLNQALLNAGIVAHWTSTGRVHLAIPGESKLRDLITELQQEVDTLRTQLEACKTRQTEVSLESYLQLWDSLKGAQRDVLRLLSKPKTLRLSHAKLQSRLGIEPSPLSARLSRIRKAAADLGIDSELVLTGGPIRGNHAKRWCGVIPGMAEACKLRIAEEEASTDALLTAAESLTQRRLPIDE